MCWGQRRKIRRGCPSDHRRVAPPSHAVHSCVGAAASPTIRRATFRSVSENSAPVAVLCRAVGANVSFQSAPPAYPLDARVVEGRPVASDTKEVRDRVRLLHLDSHISCPSLYGWCAAVRCMRDFQDLPVSGQGLNQQVVADIGGQEHASDVRHLRSGWNDGDLGRGDGDDAGFGELGGGETAVDNDFKTLRTKVLR